ncbi:hypothetical protein ABH924_004923 [Arthrobacter sp. GAS37]|uniref:hypothetical protein n=1 Tax=Arthrobacter sp. GAS37 TaxID=3156261 RepID=UPI003839883C
MTTQLSPEQPPRQAAPGQSPGTTTAPILGQEPGQSATLRSRPEATPHKPLPAGTQTVPFLAEVLIAAAGSLILWWGAEGRGVIHANQLSTTIFIAALTALMAVRGFILAMLKTSPTTPESLPAATRWLATIRNIALVVLAIYSTALNDYMAQWIIAFAAIAMAATSLAGLALAIIRQDAPGEITSRFLNSGAGILAMVFTQSIHGWDPQFISTLVSLTLVPAFFAWSLTKTIRQD